MAGLVVLLPPGPSRCVPSGFRLPTVVSHPYPDTVLAKIAGTSGSDRVTLSNINVELQLHYSCLTRSRLRKSFPPKVQTASGVQM